MSKFYEGQLVKCTESFNGVSEDGLCKHHNPPQKGEIFTIIGIDGNYLILGEVTNTQKHRGAYDTFASRKFKPLSYEETKKEVINLEEVESLLNDSKPIK